MRLLCKIIDFSIESWFFECVKFVDLFINACRFKVTNGGLRPAVLSLSRVNFTSFNGGKYHQYDRNERIYKRKFLLDVNNISRPFVVPRRSYGMLIAR